MNRGDQSEEMSTGDMDDHNEEGVDAPSLPAEFTQLLGEWCQASVAHGLAHHQWKTSAETNAIARAHGIQVSHDASARETMLRFDAQTKNNAVQEVQTQLRDWIQNAEGDKPDYAEPVIRGIEVTKEYEYTIHVNCFVAGFYDVD